MADIQRYYDPQKKLRKKIKIVGTRTYVDSIEDILDRWIHPSHVGKAVLTEIYDCPPGVEVQIKHSASGSAADISGKFEDAYALDARVDDVHKGTGKGTSSVLMFDLSGKLPSGICGTKCVNPRFNIPRYVLLHELVHSMRQMRGKWRSSTVKLNKKSVTSEEAIAIIITNIFMSEKGDNVLRADHDSLATIGPDGAAFAKEPTVATMLDRIKTDHSALYKNIAALKETRFPFNPFAAHP